MSARLLSAALPYAAREWLIPPLHTPQSWGCSCHSEYCAAGKHPRDPSAAEPKTRPASAPIERLTGPAWWYALPVEVKKEVEPDKGLDYEDQ